MENNFDIKPVDYTKKHLNQYICDMSFSVMDEKPYHGLLKKVENYEIGKDYNEIKFEGFEYLNYLQGQTYPYCMTDNDTQKYGDIIERIFALRFINNLIKGLEKEGYRKILLSEKLSMAYKFKALRDYYQKDSVCLKK